MGCFPQSWNAVFHVEHRLLGAANQLALYCARPEHPSSTNGGFSLLQDDTYEDPALQPKSTRTRHGRGAGALTLEPTA
jgi:hypothetical protein